MAIINRVTNMQLTSSFITTIQKQQYALERARGEIGSGLRVLNPSDDPSRAGSIVGLQAGIQRIDRYQQRIGLVTSILDQQEAALTSAESLLVRAREIGTQGANETLGVNERQLLAPEVFELRNALVALANTRVFGRYIYGGGDDGNPPFVVDSYTNPAGENQANVRYVFDDTDGRNITRTVQIGDSASVEITSPGENIFANAISALEQLGRSLAGYQTTVDGQGIPTGDGDAYTFPDDFSQQSADIRATLDLLQSAMRDNITVEKSRVGSRLARVDETRIINDSVKLNIEQSRSKFQDSDIIEAASRFANLEIGLEGSLRVGATINRLSLLSFL
jgi:flagellar hook-associated protein 3 FlgL